MMDVDDFYYVKSKMSLYHHIEEAKTFLHISYSSGNYYDKDKPEEKQISAFLEEYQTFYQALKGGLNAESCEELINRQLGANFQSSKLQKTFSEAMTWILCSDLLFQSGYKENAWAALIEYKKFELKIELDLDEEEKLSKSNSNRTAGKRSYHDRQYLKPYFKELLVSQVPKNGWQAMKNAASKLAPLIFKRHISSGSDVDPDTTEADVETWLTTWLKNDKQCRELYFAHRQKKPSTKI